MDIEYYLKKLNLTQKETGVYLACLELGESQIVPIGIKAELPRTTTYHILERLRNQKLIEIIQTKTRRIYAPYPPRNILTLFKTKREKLNQQIYSLEKSLPELNQLYTFSPFQPKIRFFQGKQIKMIYEEILESPIEEEWYVGESNKIINVLGEKYLKKWIKRRVEKGIKAKAIRIFPEETINEIYQPSKKYLRIVKYAPKDFKCPSHILIYGDNVAIITTGKENFGVVISSREFAESMRNWFKQLWKISK